MNKELIKNIIKYPISSTSRKWIKNYKNNIAINNIKLIMTLVVKDEEDIIEQNIRFHNAMGVDGFIVTSHNSKDKTNEILEKLKSEGLVLEILYRTDKNHKHHIWVNDMIKLAKSKYKASWIINADADEFYFSTILDLKKSIFEYSSVGINALWIDSTFVFPQEDIAYLENSYFYRPIYLNPDNPNKYSINYCFKVIHNTKDFICSTDGNHFVEMKNLKQVPCANIILYHFHIKNYKGYEAKVLRWIDSAKYMKKHQGLHVKQMIELYQNNELKKDYDEKYNLSKRNELLNKGILYNDKNLSLYLKQKGII